MQRVEKKWGYEEIIHNSIYCGKLLHIDKGAISSVHYHKNKQETFYCLKGTVSLMLNGARHIMAPTSNPITVMPEDRHSFEGLMDSILIEVSTHDDPEDSYRLTESKGAI